MKQQDRAMAVQPVGGRGGGHALARLSQAVMVVGLLLVAGLAGAAQAGQRADRHDAFRMALAGALASDPALLRFYEERAYAPLWTAPGQGRRRAALLDALARADAHGLPARRYQRERLIAAFRAARTPRTRGMAEALASQSFLAFARDLQSGVLEPARVVPEIARRRPLRDPLRLLAAFEGSSPAAFLRALAPRDPQYAALMREKLRLERIIARGGWGGKVPDSRKLEPGQRGPAVLALRERLRRMGYLRGGLRDFYDADLQKAVQVFQLDHGLAPDGVAGKRTLREINLPARERWGQVVVAMERWRWLNFDLGRRHIRVNLPEFMARVIEDGRVVYETRTVVGRPGRNYRTPEFSDEMTHLVVNPTWNVPRSIAVREYLPRLARDPSSVSHLRILDRTGREVDRSAVDFSAFTEQDFPFDLKQPPSPRNALGRVKFMFPNRFNIYLHDTPERHLFSRTRRAYSHGCIRLQRPYELAYLLLGWQRPDARSYFHRLLESGRETRVDLREPVPVHLVYFTAFVTARGRLNFREDIYGRDRRILEALMAAGVALPGASS